MPDNRFTFRTHHSFATRSNKNRLVRTPGGRLSVQHVQKKTARHTCGDTGAKLNGIPAITSSKFKALSKNKKTVARAYGGVLSAGAVRTRIIRAFLVEEKKMVKKVQKAQVRGCLLAADPQIDFHIVYFFPLICCVVFLIRSARNMMCAAFLLPAPSTFSSPVSTSFLTCLMLPPAPVLLDFLCAFPV